MVNDPTELLMWLEASTTKLQKKVVAGGWKWREGIDVYIRPETLCPYCGETFETNRVYVVDRVNFLLPKQWRLSTKRAVRKGNSTYHPHVFETYPQMCMRDAKTASQLLFQSINPRDSYHAENYVWDVGHRCKTFTMKACELCKTEVPDFKASRWAYWYLCSTICEKVADAQRCIKCFGNREDEKILHCEKCVQVINDAKKK